MIEFKLPFSIQVTMEVKDADGIKSLEHVQAVITLKASRRGDTLLFLVINNITFSYGTSYQNRF